MDELDKERQNSTANKMDKSKKYFQLVYCLLEYCTKMARSLVLFYHKKSKPPDHKDEDWTLDEFLYEQLKEQNLRCLDAKQTEILFPGRKSDTDINQWDISILFIVLELFKNKESNLCKDIFFIKKMRNSLFHASSTAMTNEMYLNFKEKILLYAESCSKVSGDSNFVEDVQNIFSNTDKEEFTMDDEIQRKVTAELGNWIKSDPFFECIERFPSETGAIMEVLFKKVKQLLNDYEFKIPEVLIGVRISRCSKEISKEVSNQLLQYMCGNISPEEKGSQLGKAVSDAREALLKKDRQLVETRQGCLILRLRCLDFEGLWDLLSDCITGKLTKQWSDVQAVLREEHHVPSLSIDLGMGALEVLGCIEDLVDYVFDAITENKRYRVESTLSLQNDPLNRITTVESDRIGAETNCDMTMDQDKAKSVKVDTDTGRSEAPLKDKNVEVDDQGWNALCVAARRKTVDELKYLIHELGFNPTRSSSDGQNLLHIASASGNLPVVKFMTDNYDDLITNTDIQGYTALHHAAESHSVDCCRFLIHRGLKPDDITKHGQNILHLAAKSGNIEVVEFITKTYRQLFNAVDKHEVTTMNHSARQGSFRCIDVPFREDVELCAAPHITTHQITSNKRVVDKDKYTDKSFGERLNLKDGEGLTPLHYAALSGSVECLSYLINAGLQPCNTKGGVTLLHFAAYNGELESVKYIILNFEDLLKVTDDRGWTSLHYAAQGGMLDCVKYLIRSGLKHNARTSDGLTILHIASQKGHIDCVMYFIKQYPDLLQMVDANGWTALHFASQSDRVECVEKLIDAGLEYDKTTKRNKTLLHLAASTGRKHVVEYIATHCSILLHAVDQDGCTALHYAAQSRSIDCVTYLTNVGLDPDKKNNFGETILHFANSLEAM